MGSSRQNRSGFASLRAAGSAGGSAALSSVGAADGTTSSSAPSATLSPRRAVRRARVRPRPPRPRRRIRRPLGPSAASSSQHRPDAVGVGGASRPRRASAIGLPRPRTLRGLGGRGLHRRELRVVDPALLDPRLLPAEVAQVVELRAADPAPLNELELGDRRRVQRERPLHADAEGDLPNGEGLADAAAGTRDHDALEHLDALTVPLDHADVHLDGVTGAEIREVRAQERLLDQIGLVHGNGRRVYQRPSGRPRARRSPCR